MALATSPQCFAYCTDNNAATTSPGTAFTAGASGVDGAAVTCIAALAHDVHHIRLRIGGLGANGLDTNSAGDLLVDPAGGTSWSALINDLVCGMTPIANAAAGMSLSYEFPLFIKAGSSIGWRCKTTGGIEISGQPQIVVEAYGEPSRPEMWWCGQGVETFGISDAKGTAITSGNASWGSWTSVGSATTRHIKSVTMGINASDAAALAVAYNFEVGYSSVRLPGSPALWMCTSGVELGAKHAVSNVTCNIPVGTQLQTRGYCSGAPEVHYAAIYGVY
jgi:hypothetical protein